MKRKMLVTGTSIACCIPPLAQGIIPLEAVEKIVGETAFESPQTLWDQYSVMYWKDIMPQARKTFFLLVEAGKIEQPSVSDGTARDSAAGIWKLGSLYLDTKEARDLLSISSDFLSLSASERDTILENLTGEELEELVSGELPPEVAGIFPDFAILAKVISSDELYSMVINRLKHLYQSSVEDDAAHSHAHIMRILMPFLKDRMSKRSNPQRLATKLTEQHAQGES